MFHAKIMEMIDAAERDFEKLVNAKSSAQAAHYWCDFLEHSNRALNRLEGYAKRSSQLTRYKKLMSIDIWEDKLARYMRLARNAHEHGIGEVQVSDDFYERVQLPDGSVVGMPILHGMGLDGELRTIPASGPVQVLHTAPGFRQINVRPSVRMAPIKDNKGQIVMPPSVEIERADEPDSVAAARKYLAWIKAQIGNFA